MFSPDGTLILIFASAAPHCGELLLNMLRQMMIYLSVKTASLYRGPEGQSQLFRQFKTELQSPSSRAFPLRHARRKVCSHRAAVSIDRYRSTQNVSVIQNAPINCNQQVSRTRNPSTKHSRKLRIRTPCSGRLQCPSDRGNTIQNK